MSLSYGSRKGNKIEWVVCHYPVAPGCDAKWCYDYYCRTNELKSAHFAISEYDVKSIVPCDKAAFHCSTYGKKVYCSTTNFNSIGIDLMDCKISCASKCVEDSDWYIPEKTLDVAAGFIAELMRIYSIDIDHIIRHYDVTHKWCPRPLVGDDINKYYGISGNERWARFKQQIMDKLRR